MLILKVFWLVVLFMTNNLVTKHPWMIGFVEYPCPPQRKYDKNFGSLFFYEPLDIVARDTDHLDQYRDQRRMGNV